MSPGRQAVERKERKKLEEIRHEVRSTDIQERQR